MVCCFALRHECVDPLQGSDFACFSECCICLIWFCDVLQNSNKGTIVISICEDPDAFSAS